MHLQCYFSHRTLLMAPVGLCSTAAASPVREASPQRLAPACASCPASPCTQGPPLGVLALRVSHRGVVPYTGASSGPPAPRGRRARGRGGTAAGNKYRSRDEQVPFSRRTSTVLTSNKYRSREGGRGRTRGGRRGAVRGTVKGRCQRCGQRPCQGARSKVQSGGAVRGA